MNLKELFLSLELIWWSFKLFLGYVEDVGWKFNGYNGSITPKKQYKSTKENKFKNGSQQTRIFFEMS